MLNGTHGGGLHASRGVTSPAHTFNFEGRFSSQKSYLGKSYHHGFQQQTPGPGAYRTG
jgi:hypothetical protein